MKPDGSLVIKIASRARRCALLIFAIYALLFPGSTLTPALDAVPVWGTSMGGLLMILQGSTVIAWLAGVYGWRGVQVALVLPLAGWAIEQIGASSGFPFGRYSYSALLQPQIGLVPVAITLAWLTLTLGAWQLARLTLTHDGRHAAPYQIALLAATLTVVVDLQIETVASHINGYWIWIDGGFYEGIPPQNFVAWWCTGLLMSLTLERMLGSAARVPARSSNRVTHVVFPLLPGLLLLASSAMYTVINLARGYLLPGIVGLIFLSIALLIAARVRVALVPPRPLHQTAD